MSKTLVLYHYFEKDQSYLDNLSHFLAFGYREDVDYVFTLASEVSVELPQAKNVKYLKVENRNYDFGGFSNALATVSNVKKYQNVIFVNCSVRGPFMPDYLDLSQWTEPFVNGLTESVALFGATICSPNKKHKYFDADAKSQVHVQSFAYCLDADTLHKLIEQDFFNSSVELTRDEVVKHYEIGLSQSVLALGKNISCLVPEYQQNYLEVNLVENAASADGDAYKTSQTFGRTLHPFETIFAKVNRGQSADQLDLLANPLFIANQELFFGESDIVGAYRNRVQASVDAQIKQVQAALAAKRAKPTRLRRLANLGRKVLRRG